MNMMSPVLYCYLEKWCKLVKNPVSRSAYPEGYKHFISSQRKINKMMNQ